MVADDEAVSACLHDGVPDCAAAETLLHVIDDAKAHQGKTLIAYINRAINLLIRPAPGAWVGALEVFTFADGDCKAYSIAKFFSLREAGVPAERLRLVIVRNRRRSENHMVVAANVQDAWFILDNATMILATGSENAPRYIPSSSSRTASRGSLRLIDCSFCFLFGGVVVVGGALPVGIDREWPPAGLKPSLRPALPRDAMGATVIRSSGRSRCGGQCHSWSCGLCLPSSWTWPASAVPSSGRASSPSQVKVHVRPPRPRPRSRRRSRRPTDQSTMWKPRLMHATIGRVGVPVAFAPQLDDRIDAVVHARMCSARLLQHLANALSDHPAKTC